MALGMTKRTHYVCMCSGVFGLAVGVDARPCVEQFRTPYSLEKRTHAFHALTILLLKYCNKKHNDIETEA